MDIDKPCTLKFTEHAPSGASAGIPATTVALGQAGVKVVGDRGALLVRATACLTHRGRRRVRPAPSAARTGGRPHAQTEQEPATPGRCAHPDASDARMPAGVQQFTCIRRGTSYNDQMS